MNHDFRHEPNGNAAKRFRDWLESETIDSLKRSIGNIEPLKSSIFLFANRACESQLADDQIGENFGRCVARAGLTEQDEEIALDLLEYSAAIARQVHGND